MLDVVVIDRAGEYAELLEARLHAATISSVIVGDDLDLADRVLQERAIDLLFLPAGVPPEAIDTLFALQPDTWIVLVTPSTRYPVPQPLPRHIRTVVSVTELRDGFPASLARLLKKRVASKREPRLNRDGQSTGVDLSAVVSALAQARLAHPVQLALLTREQAVIARWGSLTSRDAVALAEAANQNRLHGDSTNQLQFVSLQDHAGDMLTFTRPVHRGYLLTLGAVPQTKLRQLRAPANALALKLAQLIAEFEENEASSAVVLLDEPAAAPQANEASYVLAWRTNKPIPETLYPVLSTTLTQSARANGCTVTFIMVQPELVQVLVRCPATQNSSWIVHLLKSHSDAALKAVMGRSVPVWADGFYAANGTAPLAPEELAVFSSATASSALSLD